MKAIKRSVIILLAMVILPTLAIVVLILTIDPNRLKPVLENAVAQKGLTLKMHGDIGWQLYPKLGLSIGEIELRHSQTQELMTSVKQVSAAVQLKPLLERKLVVQGLGLSGLEFYYTIESDGSSAWDVLSSADSQSAPVEHEPTKSDQAPPELSIAKVRISNSKLQYHDKAVEQKTSLDIEHLNLDDISLNGQSFPIDLLLKIEASGQPALQAGLKTKVSISLEAQTFTLSASPIELKVGGQPLVVKASSDLFWGDPIRAAGELQVQPFALPALLQALAIKPPKTANSNALKRVSLGLSYQLEGEDLKLSNVKAQVDDFVLSGAVNIASFSQPAIDVQLSGTTINLDDYLPPPSENDAPTPPATQSSPTPLPIKMLRDLNVNTRFNIEQIEYSGLQLQDNKLRLVARDGVIKLSELSSTVSDGKLTANGELDASKRIPTLTANIDTDGVDLGKLLKTFVEFDQLEGEISSEFTVSSTGQTDQALIENVQVKGALQSQDLKLKPLNLEQQFCKVVALLQQEALPKNEWAEQTRFEPIKLDFSFAENILDLSSLNASIAKMVSTASGSFNLSSGDFNFPTYLSIGDFAGDIEGCLPIKKRWREQKLPLRCKGNLDSIGVTTCLPDTRQIEDLLKAKLKATLDEKVDAERARAEQRAKVKLEAEKQRAEARLEEEKLKAKEKAEAEKRRAKEKAREAEDKAKQKAREALEEKLKDEQKVKEAEEEIKGLLKGLKD